MFQRFITLFLQQGLIQADNSCNIWTKSPGQLDFVLVESIGRNELLSPSDIPVCENWCKSIIDNKSYLWFKYPEDYYVVIGLSYNAQLSSSSLDILHNLLHTFYSAYAVQRRELRLQRLLHSNLETTSLLNINELLKGILSNAFSIITADTGLLWFRESITDQIVLKASIGMRDSETTPLHPRIGYGILGRTFLSGQPKLYTSYGKIATDSHDLTKENIKHLTKAIAYNLTHSAIFMPIRIDNKIEYVVNLVRLNPGPSFTDEDINILNILTDQAAVSIKNARTYSQSKTALETMSKYIEIHDTLTKVSLQNMGIENIVGEIQKMISLPVEFADLINNELFPQNHEHEEFLSYKYLSRLFQNQREPVLFDQVSEDKTPHLVYPIINESICLGCLIIKNSRELTLTDQNVIEQGCMVLALEMTKKQSLTEVGYKNSCNTFNELLHATDSVLDDKCAEMGIDYDTYLSVGVCKFITQADPQIIMTGIHRFISFAKKELGQYCWLIFCVENKVILLALLQSPLSYNNLIKQFEPVISRAQEVEGLAMCSGFSSLFKGAQSLSTAYDEACKALSYQITRKHPGLITYPEIGIYKLLVNNSKEDIAAFVQEVFTPLQNYSKNKNGHLEQTLIAFIDNNFSPTKTAEHLYIHMNTLYQRLRKIEQCLNISFKNPQDTLRIHLACYLRNIHVTFHSD